MMTGQTVTRIMRLMCLLAFLPLNVCSYAGWRSQCCNCQGRPLAGSFMLVGVVTSRFRAKVLIGDLSVPSVHTRSMSVNVNDDNKAFVLQCLCSNRLSCSILVKIAIKVRLRYLTLSRHYTQITAGNSATRPGKKLRYLTQKICAGPIGQDKT
jgi:hypothetical protein